MIHITDSTGRRVLFATVQSIGPNFHGNSGLIMVSDEDTGWDSVNACYVLPARRGPFKLKYTRKGPRFIRERSSDEVQMKDNVVVVLRHYGGLFRVVQWCHFRDWAQALKVPEKIATEDWFIKGDRNILVPLAKAKAAELAGSGRFCPRSVRLEASFEYVTFFGA